MMRLSNCGCGPGTADWWGPWQTPGGSWPVLPPGWADAEAELELPEAESTCGAFRKEGAPSSGDCSQARAGFWPRLGPSARVCEANCTVVFGDLGDKTAGVWGTNPRAPPHTNRMTTISALADLKRSGWSSGSPGLGSEGPLRLLQALVELGRELWPRDAALLG